MSETPTKTKTYTPTPTPLSTLDQLTSVDRYSPAVDTEYRNLLERLLYRYDIPVVENFQEEVVKLSPTQIIYQNKNGIWRFLEYKDQLGAGGQDLYERVGTDTLFSSEYDRSKSTIGTGVYLYKGQHNKIRFLKTGDFGRGYYDVKDIRALTMQSYTTDMLPYQATTGTIAFDSTLEIPVYFKNNKWYKVSDNEPVANREIPTLNFRYMESPVGYYTFPLFASADEAAYYEDIEGVPGGGASAKLFQDDISGTTWYMPNTAHQQDHGLNPIEDGLTPFQGSTITWNEIPTIATPSSMTFDYIHYPEANVYSYPLFASAEEAIYYENRVGNSSLRDTGSQVVLYDYDPTDSEWYRPITVHQSDYELSPLEDTNAPTSFLGETINWVKINDLAIPTPTPTPTPSPVGHVDVYILAGQSNAEGFGDASDLSVEDSIQDGLFYVSWDSTNGTSETFDASTQYFSEWSTILTAGYTAPDFPQQQIADNNRFGPEIGLAKRLNELNTSDGAIGVLKHAVGAAPLSLWGEGSAGYTRLINAISDGITKLINLGYTYNIKGVVWWQGESGGDVVALESFVSRLRAYLAANYNIEAASEDQIPFVLTRSNWGDWVQTVSDADPYSALIDASEYGQIHFTSDTDFQQDSDGALTNNVDLIVLQDGLTLMDYGSEWTAVNTGTNVTYNSGDHLTVWMLSGSNVLIKDGTVQASRDAAVTGGTDGVWHYKGIWGIHPQSSKGDTYDTAEPKEYYNTHPGSGANGASKRYRLSWQNDILSIGEDYADKLSIAAKGLSPLWTPSEITSEGWYDFSDPTALTFDSANNITNVTNKGSGPNLFTVSGNTTLTKNIQNYKSAATMFGDNDRLQANGFDASNSTMKHLYMVLNPSIIDTPSDSVLQLTSGNDNNDDLRQLIFWAQGDTSSEFFGKVYGRQSIVHNDGNFKKASGEHAAFSTSDISDSWNIFELVLDESADTLQFVLNGTLVDTATNYTIDLINSMQLQLMFSSSGQYTEGYWGEFIATSDTVNNAKVQGYLAHKWGLADRLPQNHPYKNTAPKISDL